jgi:hypothetical protein
MGSFFRTASAVALSLFLAGGAYADPFAGVTFRVTQSTLIHPSEVLSVDADGNYTLTQDGGMAHFVRVLSQGKLSKSQLSSLQKALDKMSAKSPPSQLPGMVPGSPGFEITYDGKTISGAVNFKGAIEEAMQNGNEEAGIIWKPVEPVLQKLQSLESSLANSGSVTPPKAPDKSDAPFDQLKIEMTNPWSGMDETLTVNKDGSYSLTRAGRQPGTTLTGTLSPEQMKELVKAYNAKAVQADNGRLVGAPIPDASIFTITATEDGKTYSFNGSVESQNLGPVAALEKALVGDATKIVTPAAATADPNKIDTTTVPRDTGGVDGSTAGNGPKFPIDTVTTPRARTAGLSGTLTTRIDAATGEADGKDAATDR